MIDVTCDEHARWAKAQMLNLPVEKIKRTPSLFHPLTSGDAREALARGAAGAAVRWLQDRKDPRVYAITRYGWIRAAKNSMYVWDEAAIESICAIKSCKEFWERQSPDEHEMIDLFLVSERGAYFGGSVVVKELLKSPVDLEALIHNGQSVSSPT
jgi:hypothetical protein